MYVNISCLIFAAKGNDTSRRETFDTENVINNQNLLLNLQKNLLW